MDEQDTKDTTQEAPQVEPPKVEAPQVEAPQVEAQVEAPKAEAPASPEAPKVEAPEDNSELAELRARLAAQEVALGAARAAARETVAEALGIMAAYRSMVPDFDPFSNEGKAEARAWAEAHPEVVTQHAVAAPTPDDFVTQITAGKDGKPARNSWLLSVENIKESLRLARGGK